jgi:streptomycin 6-kinase
MRQPSNHRLGWSTNELPRKFVENVVGVCGTRGRDWINMLPVLVAQYEKRWSFRAGPHFPNLSYNYVAPARRDNGTDIVLKICLPADDGEAQGERAYLKAMAGRAVAEILEEDADRDAFLMRRADPGDDLKRSFARDPRAAVEAAIGVLKVLYQPAVDGFVSLDDWTTKLHDTSACVFPVEYTEKAWKIFKKFSKVGPSLLHGDFHHENILSSGGGFIAIDPKGIIGDTKYDIGVFLNNHYGWLRDRPDAKAETHFAAKRFSDAFDCPLREIHEWAFAQKVLAAFWTCTEGSDGWRRQLTSADIWGI